MEVLEQEKFDTVKELAEVQTNLSLAQAELKNLEDTTEEYMVVREKEAEERILKVLKESRDALDEATNNHKELTGYNSELKAYATELKQLATDITTLFKDFNDRMDQADKDMEAQREHILETSNQAKVLLTSIKANREVLVLEKADIRDQWRLLKDRQQLLKDGFDELKAKQK